MSIQKDLEASLFKRQRQCCCQLMKIGGLPWFASHAWTPCLDHRFVLKKLLKKLWCRSISDKEAPDLFTEACNCTSKKESKEPQGVASSSEEKKHKPRCMEECYHSRGSTESLPYLDWTQRFQECLIMQPYLSISHGSTTNLPPLFRVVSAHDII